MTSACSPAQVGGEEDLEAIDVKQAVGLGAIDERFRNIKVKVPAGRHRVGITYKQKTAAEHNEILNSFVPVAGMAQMVNGNSDGPRITNVEINGPLKAEGVSDTPSRRKLIVCKPASAAEETPCAKQILGTLAKRAFRRPVTDDDLAGAMAFYKEGRAAGQLRRWPPEGRDGHSLESEVPVSLQHRRRQTAKPGEAYHISDLDLASRVAFFLWSAPPDEQLIDIAAAGRLRQPEVLKAEVRRLLADPRARSLSHQFRGQLAQRRGLDLVNPDTQPVPGFHGGSDSGLQGRAVPTSSWSVFGEDRSVLELLTANWTFLNERLALHYGVPGVRGGDFRRVELAQEASPGPARQGRTADGDLVCQPHLAGGARRVGAGASDGHAARGAAAGCRGIPREPEGGEQLTVRARLEQHRAAKTCHSCHDVIDPLGNALENYNALGQWREKDIDAGTMIDAGGELADGTIVKDVNDVRNVLVSRPDLFVQTLTENLMTYALGRSVQYYDMPLIRQLVQDAAEDNYRFSTHGAGNHQHARVPDGSGAASAATVTASTQPQPAVAGR